MTEFDYFSIAKWILIVLIAGFIGQFGKSLAKHLMEKARLKKEVLPQTEETTSPPVGEHIEGSPDGMKELSAGTVREVFQEEEAKQKKNLAKALAKKKKKASKALKKQIDL